MKQWESGRQPSDARVGRVRALPRRGSWIDAFAWELTGRSPANRFKIHSATFTVRTRSPGCGIEVVRAVIDAVPDESAALFFQSDIKRDGAWIDKGAWVVRAAEDAGARVLFHKIVCRHPPGMLTKGRPGYTHLVAVSRGLRCPEMLSMPDVIIDAGRLTWVRAMGVRAAAHAVRFARDQAGAQVIFDPFCGVGS